MSEQDLMSVTLAFRRESDGTYSILSTIPKDGEDSYVPLSTLPLDALQVLVGGIASNEIPLELAKELTDTLAKKELEVNGTTGAPRVTIEFRNEPMFGWTVKPMVNGQVMMDYTPLMYIPVGVLRLIVKQVPMTSMPQDLADELITMLESKELEVQRKTEEANAFVAQTKSLGNGVFEEPDGRVVQYFPTIVVGPKDAE